MLKSYKWIGVDGMGLEISERTSASASASAVLIIVLQSFKFA